MYTHVDMTFKDYQLGTRVANVCKFPNTYMKYSIPFGIDKENLKPLDTPIPLPSHSSSSSCPFTHLTCIKHIAHNICVIDAGEFYRLQFVYRCEKAKYQNYFQKVPAFYNNCDFSEVPQQLVVKKIQLPTYRHLMTAVREIHMHDKLFKSEWNHGNIKGSDVVCRPLLAFPCRLPQQWYYYIISEYHQGISLSKYRNFFRRLFHLYDKRELVCRIQDQLTKLWLLGFSHNDVSDYNMIFHEKTKTLKLIDFETCVQLPPEHVNAFRDDYVYGTNKSVVDLYEKHYKFPSMSLLKLSEEYCCRFSDENELIYNTDDFGLKIAKDVL